MMSWNSIFFHFPSSTLMEMIVEMHDYVMMFLSSVFIIVVFNLAYTFSSNYHSLNFFEDHQLESAWTLLPFIFLIFILLPSIKVLYSLDSCMFCGLTLGITGHQWYWNYLVMSLQSYAFDSYMVDSPLRLLDVDNRVVLPCGISTRWVVTSADVIHSWTVPSFGVKMDAVPGRVNQFCLAGKKSGVYFGQCSEICGANHSFMPIVLEIVPVKSWAKI